MISTGVYGYPKDEAMEVAVETVSHFLLSHEMTVYLVVFGKESLLSGQKLFIRHKDYDIWRINEVLFEYDLPLLGTGGNVAS